jgi:hypothetical protein
MVGATLASWTWGTAAVLAGFRLSHDLAGAALFTFSFGLMPVILSGIIAGIVGREADPAPDAAQGAGAGDGA